MSLDDEKHDVFISYSTRNSEIASKICYVLEQNDIKCWIAPRNISSGRIYVDEIADAIKSTKIVVLIFSKYSQASKYVNNEINMAFARKVPIISFNVDESLPKDDMEYYLKVSQWLEAYPDPESHLETLVEDVLDLCNEKRGSSVIVNLNNFRQEDLSKHKKDYISLILLFTPFYWASFFYMGISATKKLWTLMGFVYLIPTLLFLIIYLQVFGPLYIFYPLLYLFAVIFIIFWIFAIIHGLTIRNEFLTRKSVLRFTSSDDDLFEYLYDEYAQI